jgi:hypothetical protein
VALAPQRDVLDRVLAATGEWVDVMKLDERRLVAAVAIRVLERATPAVTLEDRPSDGTRDLPGAALCLCGAIPRPLGSRESPFLGLLQQRVERQLHQVCHVPIRNLMPEQRLCLAELVVQRSARGELDLIALRRRGLDNFRPWWMSHCILRLSPRL